MRLFGCLTMLHMIAYAPDGGQGAQNPPTPAPQPVTIPVALTFSANQNATQPNGVQPFTATLANYDGDLPSVTWDNPTVAQITDLGMSEGGGNPWILAGNVVALGAPGGSANGTLSVDGVPYYILAVTSEQLPGEVVEGLTLGTYMPPIVP